MAVVFDKLCFFGATKAHSTLSTRRYLDTNCTNLHEPILSLDE